MDGWMDGWMDRWMNWWIDGWMDEFMDGWMDWWMDGRMMDGLLHRCMDERMCRWIGMNLRGSASGGHPNREGHLTC